MDARVRQATIGDLYWLRLLLGQMVEEHGDGYPFIMGKHLEPIIAGWAARMGMGDPRFLAAVAESDKVIGGFVMGEISERIGMPSPYLFVPYLYVVPPWRGTGVGRTLSTYFIDEGQRRGAKAVEMLSQPQDPQWHERGWPTVAVVHALPIEAALASIVPRHVPNGHGSYEDDQASES